MERRGGKDRRQQIDLRYQSAAYPEFIDRRKGGDRRRPSYQDLPAHPTRKFVILMGVVVAILFVCLLLIASLALTNKSAYEISRKKTITLGFYQDHQKNHTRVTGV